MLADPFSVALHSILHSPPPAGGTALVYGVGTLGLCAIPILRALHPSVRVIAVARFAHQARLAEKLGAHATLAHAPPRAVIAGVARETGSRRRGSASPPEKPPFEFRDVVSVPVDHEGREIELQPA